MLIVNDFLLKLNFIHKYERIMNIFIDHWRADLGYQNVTAEKSLIERRKTLHALVLWQPASHSSYVPNWFHK